MSAVKAVVLYPHPTDKAAFEKAYADEHVPLMQSNLPRMTGVTGTRVFGTPRGEAPYYKIVELHFDSMDDLQADFGTDAGRETARHAGAISTGGPPIVLICSAAEALH